MWRGAVDILIFVSSSQTPGVDQQRRWRRRPIINGARVIATAPTNWPTGSANRSADAEGWTVNASLRRWWRPQRRRNHITAAAAEAASTNQQRNDFMAISQYTPWDVCCSHDGTTVIYVSHGDSFYYTVVYFALKIAWKIYYKTNKNTKFYTFHFKSQCCKTTQNVPVYSEICLKYRRLMLFESNTQFSVNVVGVERDETQTRP